MIDVPDPILRDPEQFADQLLAWVVATGQSSYDESVTQLEHALQTAHLARQAKDTDAAVVAALFHDIGHLLLDEQTGDPDFLAKDLQHEVVAAEWMSQRFPDDVSRPIREHVNAKRYLCHIDKEYLSRLSPASTRSLELQGGPMSAEEAQAFAALPWCQAAVKLRKRDEGVKVAGKDVPPIVSYREAVISCLEFR